MNDYGTNFRTPTVDIHDFAMTPRAEIPRSTFGRPARHMTTFNAGQLFPIFVEEVLPGDTFNVRMTAFVRMSTPVYPIMDTIDLESWFFFVPCRLIWQHWVNFMGEQPASPSDSISYTIPSITAPAGGFPALSLYDYMGIPPLQQAPNPIGPISALPFRAYNMIWNQWFRDQNLVTAAGYGATNSVYDIGDGPDPNANYSILPLAKRHDYFTSCLPWTQKGGVAITLPLGTSATVKTSASALFTGVQTGMTLLNAAGTTPGNFIMTTGAGATAGYNATAGGAQTTTVYPSNLYADLSTATAATINQIRLAFQTQRLLERDARSGTRYVELILAHFGVRSPDYRLQRPEYLGGGISPINIAPVPQTSATGLTGGTSPVGTLSGVGTAISRNHGFRASFTEHGYIIGLIAARSTQMYSQGLRRLWTRQTRYDFYMPVFAHLGEQAVYNGEIYAIGTAQDGNVFGYQARWDEYRYFPTLITGAFRSSYTTPLDAWHTGQHFGALPALNAAFIAEPLINTMDRILAAGSTARTNNEQFIGDFLIDTKAARPMPAYSVPGMIDRM